MTREQLALRAGLEFCRSVGQPDGAAAARRVDVVGYQELPLSGPLPEKPDKPASREKLAEQITGRQPVRVGELAMDGFELRSRDELERAFPAAAQWMLPEDFALVIEPTMVATPYWVTQRCCLVIRVRGRQPTIVGGNFFEALKAPEKKPDGE